ncbi:MAG: nickel pincer cofactor biosynthesis protein LarB [Lentisphaeraceae bacterium]|nr:nickel pincer cofactor biosynthesis protein LarB [Lentisphaeraceae bacterium]
MDLDKMIAALKSGKLSDADFKKSVLSQQMLEMEDVVLDLQRETRCGLPEVVFGLLKTPETIIETSKVLLEKNDQLLVTRVDKDKAEIAMKELSGLGCTYDSSCEAIYKLPKKENSKKVLLITAGTSDIPVAREAELTCKMFGLETTLKVDVGVAALQRILNIREDLLDADCIVVCAGMEGALPSVVGGLVGCPVIAVPVSCGYGTSFAGMTAMLGMLSSCASGLTVVNVDNGFGAGYAAGRMLRDS